MSAQLANHLAPAASFDENQQMDWCIQHARYYLEWITSFALELAEDDTLYVVIPQGADENWRYALCQGFASRMPRSYQVVSKPSEVQGPWVLCADALLTPNRFDTLFLEYGQYFSVENEQWNELTPQQFSDDPVIQSLLVSYLSGAVQQMVHIPLDAWAYIKSLTKSQNAGLLLASGLGNADLSEMRLNQGVLGDTNEPIVNFHAWGQLAKFLGFDGDQITSHDHTVSAVHWKGLSTTSNERLDYRLAQCLSDDIWPMGESIGSLIKHLPAANGNARLIEHYVQRVMQALWQTPPLSGQRAAFQLAFQWLADHQRWQDAQQWLELYGYGFGSDDFLEQAVHHVRWHTGQLDETCVARRGELSLQTLSQHHAASVWQQYQDPSIGVMTRLPPLNSLQDVRLWIQSQNNDQRRTYAVVHENHGLVGVVSVRFVGEIGYFYFWIGQNHQGQGFAEPAARLLLSQANAMGVTQLYTSVYQDNVRSLRVMRMLEAELLSVQAQDPDQALRFFHYSSSTKKNIDHPITLGEFLEKIQSPIKLLLNEEACHE